MAKGVTLSAFGDEAALDFEEQLQVLSNLNVPQVDLRAAWGVRCDKLTDEQVDDAVALLKKYNMGVGCMGTPIGKYPIQDSMDSEIAMLQRLGYVADKVGTKNIRFFSYYPQGDAVTDAEIEESISRIKQLVAEAEKLDLVMQLENEKHLVGDIPERMLKIFEGVDNPRLRFIWDPANFVQCGVMNQVDEWWDTLSPYIGYIHIKDAKSDGTVYPAGQGEGQVPELLTKLKEIGYEGVLSLEPHLAEAKHSSGFSGPELMKVAVDALRDVMKTVGMEEQ